MGLASPLARDKERVERDRLSWLYPAIALFLTAIAFSLRLSFLRSVHPYPDELVSLLAVRAILERGLPLLPSGLFYEHGLLFSYLGALSAALFGFGEAQVRLSSLVLGTLTVPLLYYVGRRLFAAGASVGLLAATLLALSPEAVEWGGRARMYALLQFLVLLAVFAFCRGALLADRPVYRYGALLACLGAVLAHFAALALVPPLAIGLALAGIIAAPRGQRPWFLRRRVALEAAGLTAIVLVSFLVKRLGQPKGISTYRPLQESLASSLEAVFGIYTRFTLDWLSGVRSLAPFFTSPWALLPSLLVGVGLILLLYRLGRGAAGQEEAVTLFLYLLLGLTVLEMVFAVAPERRDSKYLFMLAPVFYLLAADTLRRLARGRAVGLLTLGVAVAAAALSLPGVDKALAQQGGDYRAAFEWVRENRQEGDKIMVGTPAAAGLYLGECDFYLMQDPGYAYRLLEKDGVLVDRWMGAPWIGSADELNPLLGYDYRVWLVVERWGLLREYYEPFLRAQILARMDLVWEDEGLLVFVSAADRRYVSGEPRYRVEALLGGRLRLLGYSLDTNYQVSDSSSAPCIQDPASCIAVGEVARVTLYWQAVARLEEDYAVFVHLVDGSGKIALQADHMPLDSVMPTSLWRPGEIVREASHFVLPPDISPGVYELRTGVYLAENDERLLPEGGGDFVTLGKLIVE
jgi:4-amino-4-deoxy-L-arabinose transferase-like glycosyltransferase